jgi:tetratricopeptide (TPR) repeat protein
VKTRIVLAGLLVGSGAASVAAQQPAGNDRVIKAMPTKYVPPKCELKPGHYKVSSGATYLKTGIETEIPENRTRALNSGEKVLLEAIHQNGQDKNPAAWYYLGRIYLQRGDLVGADSALSKAEAMSPSCKQDFTETRYVAWVPLVNGGITFAQKQNNDSALALFREANTIYRDKPSGYLNAGVIFANTGQNDSAIVYWKKAAEIGEQTNTVEDRNAATRNLGAMYQRLGRHQEAIPVLEKYLTWVPKDTDVKRALATSYRAVGQNDKAAAIEKEVGPAPAAAGAGAAPAGSATAGEINAAIALYNAKKYDSASTAFEKIVAAEPYNRDALYGLANAYIATKNPKLGAVATQLAAIEPLNAEIIRMQANGLRMAKKETQANKAATQVLGMPVSISVNQFAPTAAGATISGTATGREAQTPQGKPVAATPITVVFEFLDAKGTVVGNQEVQVPALKPGASQPIEAKAEGAGIAAWRYKRK